MCPYAELSVKEIRDRMGQRLKDYLPEADNTINNLSRALVVAMKREFGNAFLIKINLYGSKERGKEESICWEWDGGMIYNFGADAVAPIYHEELVKLILERDTREYIGPKEDAKSLNEIYRELWAIGGEHLIWS